MKKIVLPNEEPTAVVIDTAESSENYRARVYQMPSGTIVTIPVKEGSRGPLYTENLTSTKHGRLRTTSKHYHLSFDIPLSEGLEYAGNCVEEEIAHFINFMKTITPHD